MCGFIGTLGAKSPYYKERVKTASSVLRHRGPDNTKFFSDDFFTVVFNRLKVIDLSDEANQPFEDSRFVLVFNGEIYNYLELKKKLSIRTKTEADTEVLFEILKSHKSDIGRGLNLLNGMFAFAFYDKQQKKLVLGRDRLGVKPLYYIIDNQTVFFGSEIKALGEFVKNLEVNHRAVINFLVNRILDYNKETFFKNVYQVKPATFIEFQFGENGILRNREIKYWDLKDFKEQIGVDDVKTMRQFKDIFFDAVSLRLRADVPVAALLSGGLDSSAVVSTMAYLNPDKEIISISARYKDDPKDETNFAMEVVKKYPNIKPFWVDIEKVKFFDSLEKTVYHQETPIPDGSIVSQLMLMEQIHSLGIKVVITGQGGDEILGGYSQTFLPAWQADNLRKLSFKHFNGKALFHAQPAIVKNAARKILYLLRYSRYFKNPKKLFLTERFYKHFRDKGILTSYLIMSESQWTLPGFLHYDDRNSMAFSIESRGPFLDYRLVEFMLSLPNDFKIRNNVTKWILRTSLKNILPRAIVSRRDKQGFYAPIEKWSSIFSPKFLEDSEFRKEFYYLNFKEIVKDPIMKWRIYTLWIWYKYFIT